MSSEHAEQRLFTSPVNSERVRPVGFDRDRCEALVLDQAFGNVGAVSVEFVGPMGAVTNQDDLGVTCRERLVSGGLFRGKKHEGGSYR